ncbi:MAG: 50S ribosomal protein L24 [Kiloniellales bacterium]
MARSRIKKGDRVVVITGRNKGMSGEVLRVLKDRDRAIVQGVNMVKRHRRPSRAGPGGIEEIEAPIHLSNLAQIDPKTSRPTRIGYRFMQDGRKVRFAKRSGEIIDA